MYTKSLTMLTGQFADKPTRGQSGCGLSTRRQQIFKNRGITTLYIHP